MLEFTFDDLMRIRSWHFMTRQHHELVPRSVAVVQVRFLAVIVYSVLHIVTLYSLCAQSQCLRGGGGSALPLQKNWPPGRLHGEPYYLSFIRILC